MPVPGSGKQQIWPDAVCCFLVSWLRQRRYKSPVHLKLLRYWYPHPSAHARRTTDCHLHELPQTFTFKSVSLLRRNPKTRLPCSLRMRVCAMDVSSPFLPSRQHVRIEALEALQEPGLTEKCAKRRVQGLSCPGFPKPRCPATVLQPPQGLSKGSFVARHGNPRRNSISSCRGAGSV